ncbi:hypothetical protein FRUB_04210 [Fimbriiglobus ruber]|uniref:Uncharacterized protein n=1 Tax=Fimbriiglobus ruber TaxID=1908690 RepID=A0A225DL41_9BACT|nr:hypothetical protein FRUB_04210 [Fimbriiglobus ruber]
MQVEVPHILLRLPARRPRLRLCLRQFSIGGRTVRKLLGDEYRPAAPFVRDQVQNPSAKATPE